MEVVEDSERGECEFDVGGSFPQRACLGLREQMNTLGWFIRAAPQEEAMALWHLLSGPVVFSVGLVPVHVSADVCGESKGRGSFVSFCSLLSLGCLNLSSLPCE